MLVLSIGLCVVAFIGTWMWALQSPATPQVPLPTAPLPRHSPWTQHLLSKPKPAKERPLLEAVLQFAAAMVIMWLLFTLLPIAPIAVRIVN